jgi:hypothetical protein
LGPAALRALALAGERRQELVHSRAIRGGRGALRKAERAIAIDHKRAAKLADVLALARPSDTMAQRFDCSAQHLRPEDVAEVTVHKPEGVISCAFGIGQANHGVIKAIRCTESIHRIGGSLTYHSDARATLAEPRRCLAQLRELLAAEDSPEVTQEDEDNGPAAEEFAEGHGATFCGEGGVGCAFHTIAG